MEKRYTAEEAAEKLREEGDKKITKRTINYYAFDQSMFKINLQGKKIFTEAEIDKIRAIRLLRVYTDYKLKEIKKLINSKTLLEIKEMCLEKTEEMSDTLRTSEEDAGKPAHLRLKPDSHSFHDTYDTDYYKKGYRTIKINNDVRLTVSSSISDEKILKIIGLIKNTF